MEAVYVASALRRKPRNLASALVVQLDVPVQVIAPALRRVPEADCDADRRRRIGTPRVLLQAHAGFGGREATLLSVTTDAAGHDVLPVLAAALGDRHDMVER